jgi:hypothetical protein
MNNCTRPTAECNSSLDHFHYRRPNILNYCNNIHQITVLLPNHTFHKEIEHNLAWFSETISLISFDWFLSHEHLSNQFQMRRGDFKMKNNNKSVVPLPFVSCIDWDFCLIYIYSLSPLFIM